MIDKPSILVVNDDGIDSHGIQVLIQAMRDLGHVYVVAPNGNRSASSHSMTLYEEIYVQNTNGRNEFRCSGTPVDCVKLALNKLLPQKPDLCVSGINHGSNHSINGLYSGTLHAAMEGTIQGISSISFSHLSYNVNLDLTPFNSIIKSISQYVLKYNLPKNITLNINFPDVIYSKIKGIKLCQQGKGKWQEKFELKKVIDDKYHYLISGEFNSDKHNPETDSWALSNNFISIVPVNLDMTTSSHYQKLKSLENVF
tara:strand:+ start:1796 stop:2560 length:765 start_codon:yes stop_codon:yes gene_type:complete